MTRPYLAAVTDFDGTLVDTRAANAEAYGRAFAAHGRSFDRQRYDELFGLRYAELMAELAPDADADEQRSIAAAKADEYRGLHGMMRLNRDLVEQLRGMRVDGVRTGLASTARRLNVAPVLETFGIADLFDVLIFGEDVRRGKPDPECYERAVAALGVASDQTLVFEDSEAGIAAASAAGCRVVEVRL